MPGIYRVPVALTWDDPGSPGANVWHVNVADGGDNQTRLQAAVDSIHSFYADLTGGGSSNGLRAELVVSAEFATQVDDQEQLEVDFTTLTVGGTVVDAPPMCQVCIGWKTSSASRRGRGRTFIGPLSQAAIDSDGTVAASTLSAIESAATGYVNRSQAATDWSAVVYGLAVAGGGPDSVHTGRQITGMKVRDTMAVLRSRRD